METGGADQWVLKRRECSGLARVNKVTSASLGYPLSVFNINTTLKSNINQTGNFETLWPNIIFFPKKGPYVTCYEEGWGVGWLDEFMGYFSTCMSRQNNKRTPW